MKKLDWKRYVKKTTAVLLLAGMLLSSARVGDAGIRLCGEMTEDYIIKS